MGKGISRSAEEGEPVCVVSRAHLLEGRLAGSRGKLSGIPGTVKAWIRSLDFSPG